MKALNKRLKALELGSPGLSAISEEELTGRLFRVISDIEATGAPLPADWGEQFEADPVRLVDRVGDIVRSMQ